MRAEILYNIFTVGRFAGGVVEGLLGCEYWLLFLGGEGRDVGSTHDQIAENAAVNDLLSSC